MTCQVPKVKARLRVVGSWHDVVSTVVTPFIFVAGATTRTVAKREKGEKKAALAYIGIIVPSW